MGKYLGYVAIVNNGNSVYYNFQLSHEIIGTSFTQLTMEDRAEILPDSQRKEINLYFDYRSSEAQELMSQYYQENAYYVAEFTLNDLEDNIKSDYERNPTGYKISGLDSFETGRIRSLDAEGFFLVIQDQYVKDRFYHNPMVQVNPPQSPEHMKYWGYSALVQLEDGFYAGPFDIYRREQDGLLYIRPELEESKYLIWGYTAANINIRTVTAPLAHRYSESISITVVPKNLPQNADYRDVITEERLMESFEEMVKTYGNGLHKLELRDLNSVLDQYNNSFLHSVDLPKEVREARMSFMQDLFTSQQQLGETLQRITTTMSHLLEEQKDHPTVTTFFQQLRQEHGAFAGVLTQESTPQSSEKFDKLLEETQEQEDIIRHLKEQLREVQIRAVDMSKRALDEHLNQTTKKHATMTDEIRKIRQEMGVARDVEALGNRKDYLKERVNILEMERTQLEMMNMNLEDNIASFIDSAKEDMAKVAFNGFISNKMISAAADWEAMSLENDYQETVKALNSLDTTDLPPIDLIAYLVDTVKTARPDYHHNTILNMAICISQGFLTVFSGEPGCGKTSICHILAQTLGLTQLHQSCKGRYQGTVDLDRYVQISVERGWTSKRDFVGYFNPLSKNFDKTNSKMYDALKILDLEEQEKDSKFPMLVLLDEANLSPMEYYWADFMNICDDLDENSEINLGENHVFTIPETLHFLATINSDHTTEMLSPRLIDRSWVIKLPSSGGIPLTPMDSNGNPLPKGKNQQKINKDKIQLITWASMQKAFVPETIDLADFSHRATQVMEQLKLRLRDMKVHISSRTELAIYRYLTVASKYMKKGALGEESSIVALDYAVAQRILPKIVGNGESFRGQLEDLLSFCRKEDLNHASEVLSTILEQGDKQMQYYQFF